MAYTVTITNLLKKADVEAEKVWNTGACALGCPHADEDAANAGKALVADDVNLMPELKHGQAMVQIYGNKGIVKILGPEETLDLIAETDEERYFYEGQIQKDFLDVKAEVKN